MATRFESIEKEVEMMAEKAVLNGHWFYSSFSGEWITPEDFVNLNKVHQIAYGEQCRDIVDKYKASDPRRTIADKMEHIKKSNVELQEFTYKVFNYFNMVKKEKRQH